MSDGLPIKREYRELYGWIRCGITVAVVLASMIISIYYFKWETEAHINNTDIHAGKNELSEIFVTRREYNDNITAVRDDLRYMRNRIDALIDRMDRRGEK